MAVFNDLPDELVDNICRSGAPLRALCLTSKRWLRFAQSHLYASVRITHKNVIAFIKTSSSAAELCGYVHELEIDISHLRIGDIDDDDIEKIGLDLTQPKGMQELYRQCFETILSRLSALKKLEIRIEGKIFAVNENAGSFNDMWKSYPSRPSFPQLRSLSLKPWDTEDGFDLRLLLPVFSIASQLEIINTTKCTASWFIGTWSFPSVKELTLEEAVLTEGDLEALVNAFPELETFCYCTENIHAWPGWVDADEVIGSVAIGRALEPLQRSLKTLVIDQSETSERFEDPEDHTADEGDGRVESLAGFKKLQTLVIWHHDIVKTGRDDWEVEDEESESDSDSFEIDTTSLSTKLPSSLRKLYVVQSHVDIDSNLIYLAQQAATTFQSLETVILDHIPDEDVTLAFGKAKIELKIRPSYDERQFWR